MYCDAQIAVVVISNPLPATKKMTSAEVFCCMYFKCLRQGLISVSQIRLLLEEQSDLGPHYLLQRRSKRTSRRHTADEDEIMAKNFDNRVHIFFNS